MAVNDVTLKIVALFDEACIDQLESMGCIIKRVDKPSEWGGFLSAYIKAESDDLSLNLLINMPAPLLAQTMPSGGQYNIADPELQKDWLLELANRFVGRLKNKLLRRGCILKIGIPASLENESQSEGYLGAISTNKIFSANKILRCYEISGDVASDVMECRLYIDINNENLELLDDSSEDDSYEEGSLENL